MFARISPLKHLAKYDLLQNRLRLIDVSCQSTESLEYQKTFNGYYRMRQRPEKWYQDFFASLESHKHNASITLAEVLQRFHTVHSRVELSFSSKFVATIRPELPVFDSEVAERMGLKKPAQYLPAEERIRKSENLYRQLNEELNALLSNRQYTSELQPRFDVAFPAYTHFTPMKKLDLMLWQWRSEE